MLQRVDEASVQIKGNLSVQKIGEGVLVFLAVHVDDDDDDVNFLVNKLLTVRMFANFEGKTQYSLEDFFSQKDILIISQFTLYANCRKGRKPNFLNSANPHKAKCLYDDFITKVKCRYLGGEVKTGEFGSSMEVSCVNQGPFTLILDS